MSSINDAMRYSYNDDSSKLAFLNELMKKTAKDIQEVVDEPEKNKLSENQIKVGNNNQLTEKNIDNILKIFENREDVEYISKFLPQYVKSTLSLDRRG